MFKMKTKLLSFLSLFLILTVVFTGLISQDSFAQAFLQTDNTYKGTAPKYVFLFIGDGTSFPQISAAEMYLGAQLGTKEPQTRPLGFTNFPGSGVAATFDSDSFIPDSASTGTSLASGVKTGNGIINMDPTKKINYDPITRSLKAKGYKIGVISNVSIDHATPAVFYANQESRNNYYEIGLQLANSNFDYFGGGGFKDPVGKKSKMENPENVLDVAKRNGYKIANTKEDILALNAKSGKVIAINPQLDNDMAMPFEIDRKDEELKLSDFVRKGIEVLDNSKGYFMMVEAGKIDWANHANDAAASIHDTIEFDNAVKEAVKVYEKYPKETLIVVTGDHECGGLSIGFAGTAYKTFFNKLEKQTMSYIGFDAMVDQYRKTHTLENAKLEDLYPQIKAAYGLITAADADAKNTPDLVLTEAETAKLRDALKRSMISSSERKLTSNEQVLYGTYEPLTVTLSHILNNKAGLNFSSYSHTGLPVPVYAIGVGHELFIGSYDNTDIYKKIASITKVK
ncbi:MAG: alkaline phosphatase [Bacillota bacterium]